MSLVLAVNTLLVHSMLEGGVVKFVTKRAHSVHAMHSLWCKTFGTLHLESVLIIALLVF